MELTIRAAVDQLSAISFPADNEGRAVAVTLAAAQSSRLILDTFSELLLADDKNAAQQRPTPKQARSTGTDYRVVRARRPALFRQADVTRAVKAMEKAGKEVGSARIDKDGRIVVVCLSEPASEGETNEWDTVLKK